MENGKVTVYIVRRDSTGHWAVVLGVQTAEVEKCLGMLIIKLRHPRPALTTIILLQPPTLQCTGTPTILASPSIQQLPAEVSRDGKMKAILYFELCSNNE